MARILVIGPSWVGDMVMAQSLFMFLRSVDPEVVIDVVAPEWSGPLLARMPEVKSHIELGVGHGALGLGERYRIGRVLGHGGYDRAIVLPRSWKAALIPCIAGIPRRTGYRGESRFLVINDMRALDEALLPRTVQRYVTLGAEPGDPLPPHTPTPRLRVDPANQSRLIEEFGLATGRSAVGFVPGAEYGPAKRWPPEFFAGLAVGLRARGFDVWMFGSNRDREVCGQIAALAGDSVTDLSGRTRLEDVVDLIAATDHVVSNDSGLMHIAAATGRRVVAIFGSSSPSNTPPLSEGAQILTLGLGCSPCYQRECPFGHYNCLTGISVARVMAATLTLPEDAG